MAELKPLGRKIGQPNAPDISKAGEGIAGLEQANQTLARQVGEYAKRADSMQTNVLYADAAQNLSKSAIDSAVPENIAQGDVYNRYLQDSQAFIDQTIEQAPRGYKQALGQKLKQIAGDNALQLHAKERDFRIKESKATVEIAIDTAKTHFNNVTISGDPVAIQNAKEDVLKFYDDGIELGLLTKQDRYLAAKELDEKELVDKWTQRGRNDAIAEPGTVERELVDLVREFPDETLTNEERNLALQSYAKGASVTLTYEQSQRALNAANTNLGILKGDIESPADISGQGLTALQGVQAETTLWKHQHKKTKENTKVADFLRNVAQGGGVQNLKASEETKEAGWLVSQQIYLEGKKEQTGNPDEQLTIEDQANILSQINVPIPSVTEQVKYALNSANVETELPQIEWALGMLRSVAKDKPNVFKDLNETERATANLANVSLQYGRTDVRAAIESARKTVNVDEPVLVGRRARQYKSGWTKEMRNAFENMTGKDPDANPEAWGAFQQIYSSQAMISDSQSVARESARQIMEPAFGSSKFFREDEYGYLPPEKLVPFGETGSWLESQINMKLIDIAIANHNAPDDQISNLSKIEIGGNHKEAARLTALHGSKEFEQENLFNYRYGPNAYTQTGHAVPEPIKYRINGEDRQAYLMANSGSRVNKSGKLSYTVYTINPQTGLKEPVQDPRTPSGFATITVDSLEEFLPEVYNKLNDELYDKAAYQASKAEYKKRTPIYNQFLGHEYLYGLVRQPQLKEQLKKADKAYTEEEVFKSSTGATVTDVDIKKQLAKLTNEKP